MLDSLFEFFIKGFDYGLLIGGVCWIVGWAMSQILHLFNKLSK